MRIEHIAIWVNDLEKMRGFYQKHFNMNCGNKYENPAKGFSSYFLSFDTGARIELMKQENIAVAGRSNEPSVGLAHIAISVGSRKNVDMLTDKLRHDKIKIVGEPRTTGDGYYESVIEDCEGNCIEITE